MLVPLQQSEGIDIRRRSDAFAEKVDNFVKFFQKRAPFALAEPDLKLEHVSPRPLSCTSIYIFAHPSVAWLWLVFKKYTNNSGPLCLHDLCSQRHL